MPSPGTRRTAGGREGGALSGRGEVGDQRVDARGDLVAYFADGLQVLAGRVLELPVLVALARIDGAGVSAAHRDHDVGFADHAVVDLLGPLGGDVDSELVHGGDHGWVQLVGRFA